MTDSLTPLASHQSDSRVSRASQVRAPTRARATLPDLNVTAPLCPDCDHQLDSPDHARLCEDQP